MQYVDLPDIFGKEKSISLVQTAQDPCWKSTQDPLGGHDPLLEEQS